MGTNLYNFFFESKFLKLIVKLNLVGRYVVAVAGAGFVYTLIQLPFAMYHAATGKRWIRNGWLPEFDFYADKVLKLILHYLISPQIFS